MSKKRHTAEQIIIKLREAEILQSKGQSIVEACRQLRITDQTYYQWRKESHADGFIEKRLLKSALVAIIQHEQEFLRSSHAHFTAAKFEEHKVV